MILRRSLRSVTCAPDLHLLCRLHCRFTAGAPASGSSPRPPAPSPKRAQEQIPTKDRSPPRLYNPNDPRRRLAVLIDASKFASPQALTALDGAIAQVGTPIIQRVFATELGVEWADLLTDKPSYDWFRVEKFIPVSMQIGADAMHIGEFRHANQVEAIAYVVTQLEKHHFEQFFDRLKGTGMNQYVFDETGLVAQHCEDGREGDGAPTR